MSDADIVRQQLELRRATVSPGSVGREECEEALAALARMKEQEKSLLGRALMLAHERDRLQGALRDLRRETEGLPKEHDRLKEQLANLRDVRDDLAKQVVSLEKKLAEADANGLRLAEENEALRGNLKGNPVLTTFDGIARLQDENLRLVEENERLIEEREQALNEPSRRLAMCQQQNRTMSLNIEHLHAELDRLRWKDDNEAEVERLRKLINNTPCLMPIEPQGNADCGICYVCRNLRQTLEGSE